jgi:hypothetical protein
MEYLLLIYDDEKQMAKRTPEERAAVLAEYRQYAAEVREAGIWVGANPLQESSTATSVRVRDGKTVMTDGPFAETMEQLAGYFLIDVPNLDEALRWGAKIPGAKWGTIEVRPVWSERETSANDDPA